MNELSRQICTKSVKLSDVVSNVNFYVDVAQLNKEMRDRFGSQDVSNIFDYVNNASQSSAVDITFVGCQSYYALCKSGIIFADSFVRRSPGGGTGADESYDVVTQLGKQFCFLSGDTNMPTYPGPAGIFHPASVLAVTRDLPNNEWSISNFHLRTYFRITNALENLEKVCLRR